MRVGVIVGVLALGLFQAFQGSFGSSSTSWNQRLTLVILTPQGEVRGSAVTNVRASFYSNASMNFGTEVVYGLTGEATVVEVLPGRLLFALKDDSEELCFRAAKDRFAVMTRGAWLHAISGQTEPVGLSGDLIPMLVTFDDITKPETMRRVDPADLAAVFGEGVRLKAVTLEITEEAVTEGRVETMPFWKQLVEQRTFSGLHFFDPERPASIDYLTYDSLKMMKP